MDVLLRRLVIVISFVSRCISASSIVMSVPGDMDQQFFAQLSADIQVHLQVWHSDGRRLVVTSDNPLQSLSCMEAPNLQELETFPNSRLEQLILRLCPLDGLVKSLYNLRALRMLKIENCRVNGTLNLAELLPLQNLTSLSLEANRLTEVIFNLDEASNETQLMSPLVVLNLCSNKIEYFNLDVLRSFPDLKDLLMQRNKILRITGSVYLPALLTLDAKDNLLTELNLTGCNCSALLFVYASSNKLSRFPLLSDTATELQVLDLNVNQLTELNATELAKRQNLRTLLLAYNALKSLRIDDEKEPTVELPLLSVLDLHANQIEVLDLRGWQLPSLQTLIVNVNPLIALPDDLLERFPKLVKFSCYCANVDCEWIQRHVQHVQSGRFDMSVAWQGPKELSEGSRCVTVPYIGCVRCPFKRKSSTTS